MSLANLPYQNKTCRWTYPLLFGLLISLTGPYTPAAAELDLETYHQFLEQNAELSAADLLGDYGSDVFRSTAPAELSTIAFLDNIDQHYQLSTDEKDLRGRH